MDVGKLRHSVTLENPGPDVPDGRGGFTKSWTPLSPPHMNASIVTATTRNMERLVASSVQSTASHLIEMRYHPDVTTETRLTWADKVGRTHTANVTYVDDFEQLGIELRLAAEEIVA